MSRMSVDPLPDGPLGALPPEIDLEGGAPVALSGGTWQVREGTVEAYLVWPGGRRLLAVRETGGTVFAPSPGDAGVQIVAPGGARLVQGEAKADAAAGWVTDCAAAVRLPVPDLTVPEAGAVHHATADEALGGTQVLWLMPGSGAALTLCGTGVPVLAPDAVPVTGALWARVRARGDVRVRTSSEFDPGRLADAVAQFTAMLAEVFDAMAAAAERTDLARLGQSAGAGPDRAGTEAEAVRAAATFLGQSPGTMPTEGAIPVLARAAGLRARRIMLEADWHRRDQGTLIVRRDGVPETLDWRGTAYVRLNGTRVTAREAATTQHAAWVVSAPLDDGLMRLWRMMRYVMRGNRRDVAMTALAAGGGALMGLLVPLATGWLLGDIVPAGMVGLLFAVGLALGVAALVSAFLSVARALATTRIGGRGSVRMAAGLTDRVLRLPTRFFKDYSAGDLNQRLQNVDQMRELAVSIALSAGLTAGLSLVYLGALFFYDLRLALLAIVLVTGYILAVVLARVLQMEAIREAANLDGEIAGLTYETLEGVAKLRLSAAEDRALARWLTLYTRERRAQVRAGRVSTHFGAFADTYQTITLIGLFAAAALLTAEGMAAGQFIAFLAAFGSFQGAFVGLSETFLRVYAAQPLMDRARPVLEAEPETAGGRADAGRLTGEIEGSGITFSYGPGLAPVLDGLDFRVRPGEHMAIVGGSGSGKSTLLRLLLGFESPQTGAITYDGQDLSRLDLTSVRSQIGVVLQASQLFAGSILDNIRGASSADLETCMEAARKAGLARDLEYFAMGLHTPITEGGATLSGGQRQRILIARALAQSPAILYFDEATSALDNRTQAQVAETLDAMKITRITIAHRLSTVRNADMICVLKAGRFVERGTFAELMALDGEFAALARRQLTED